MQLTIGKYKLSLKSKDGIMLFIIAGWAAYFYWEVSQLPRPDINLALIRPVSIATAVLLGYYVFKQIEIKKIETEHSDMSEKETKRSIAQGVIVFFSSYNKTIMFLLLVSLYTYFLYLGGFLLTTIIFVVITMKALGENRVLNLTLISLGMTFAFYFFFVTFLGLRLPVGVLENLLGL